MPRAIGRPDSCQSSVRTGRATQSGERARGEGGGLERRVTDTAVILALPAGTLFAFDRADLTADAAGDLRTCADAIRAGVPGDVTVCGCTDAKGTSAHNLNLSTRRAQAVADWMGEQVRVRLHRFVVSGEGESDPIAANTRPDGFESPEGRTRNRCAEIVIRR